MFLVLVDYAYKSRIKLFSGRLFCVFVNSIMHFIMRKFYVFLKLLCMESPLHINYDYVALLIIILFCVSYFSLCIL